jgi:site-specific recombinase XerC
MLCDWLILGHVLEVNPATAVRRPKHIVKKGKTPILSAEAARQLLDAGDLVRLHDRAVIAVCLYSCAQIEAALGMDVGNYYPNGKRWWFRLQEKGVSRTRCRRITKPRNTSSPTCKRSGSASGSGSRCSDRQWARPSCCPPSG